MSFDTAGSSLTSSSGRQFGKVWTWSVLAAIVLVGSFPVRADDCAVRSGNWTANIWNGSGGCRNLPDCGGPTANPALLPATRSDPNGGTIAICKGITVVFDPPANRTANDLYILAGATLQGSAARSLNLGKGGGEDVVVFGLLNFAGTPSQVILGKDSTWTGTGIVNADYLNINNKKILFCAPGACPSGPASLTFNLSGAGDPLVNPSRIDSLDTVTWNYNGTAPQQLSPRPTVLYGNLVINNLAGVSMATGLTPGSVVGDVTIATGALIVPASLSPYQFSGNATKTFRILPGARFEIYGSSNPLSGFGTVDYGTTGACGTVSYAGTDQTIAATPPAYGNLTLGGSGVKTMPGTPLTVACDYTMFGTASATAAGSLTVGRNFRLNPGTTFGAAAFVHTVGGNFTNSGSFAAGASTFDFNGAAAQSVSAAATMFNDFRVTNSAAAVTAVTPFTVAGTLNIAAAGANFSDGGNIITVQGGVSVTGAHTGAGRLLLRNGLVVHPLSGSGSVTNLELDDGLGATLGSDFTVAGTLTLTNGLIATGARTLVTTANCNAPSVVRAAGYVEGRLQKRIPAGASSCWFEVGSNGDYAPVLVAHGAGTTAGSLLGYTTIPDHPNIGTAGLDPAKSANRYWTLTAPLTGSAPAGSYSATFNFPLTNLDPGANTAVFEVRRYAPPFPGTGIWSNEAAGTRTGTSTQALGLSSQGDFAVGEPGSTVFSREKELIFTRERY